jgi:Ran GTPase-activating protein (RanGAP) involved in mRNA processing and transport
MIATNTKTSSFYEGSDPRTQTKGNIIESEKIVTERPNRNNNDESLIEEENLAYRNAGQELKKGDSKKDYIIGLFPRKLFAELYFAWCKDCSEPITIENAKYFRDEISMRNNKDLRSFNFRSLRVGRFFLTAFVGNFDSWVKNIDLADNVVSDLCMHNLKNIISNKRVQFLDLSSNMISTEGLKIIQNDLMKSEDLKYLNLGVVPGCFRRNNFSGEGGLILAKILLSNSSISTLILQDNDLGETNVEKIGSALIQNTTLRKLKIADNKIKNKGAYSILQNSYNLVNLNLSNNEITPEVCGEIKKLLENSINIQELNWDSNNIGVKGINQIIEGLQVSRSLRHLSIKNTNLGDLGLKILANGLRYNKYLHTLDVSSNSITYESFIQICDCLSTNQITTLKIKNNLLGDESMLYFSENILSYPDNYKLTYFDFSSCKIYDQGLIYLLSKLVTNDKILKIKLRDNYFTHEIDYVVIDFIEKNYKLTLLDLNKNRFSYQCLQKLQKIVERNQKMVKDKEPNKLLIEIYRLKYENTKLNEMKECLKFLENDVEKLKLNRADIRMDYESYKAKCDEDIDELEKENNKLSKILSYKKKELEDKLLAIEKAKTDFINSEEDLTNQIEQLKIHKETLEKQNEEVKGKIENTTKEYISKIDVINQKIDEFKKKELDLNKQSKEAMEHIVKLDKQIMMKQIAIQEQSK